MSTEPKITPSLSTYMITTPNTNIKITPLKLYESPVKKNYRSSLSPTNSSAKNSNVNTRYKSSYIEKNISLPPCNIESKHLYITNLNSKKPNLNAKLSRNKMMQYKSTLDENALNELIQQRKKLLISEQEKTLLVPLDKKDDDNFKLLTMKQIKKKSLPLYKSAKKVKENNIENRKELDEAIQYSNIRKKKIVHSVKKNIYIVQKLYDKDGMSKKFPLFTDQDIGVYKYWQAPLIESQADEDVDTDDEQLALAKRYSLIELKEGIERYFQNGNNDLSNSKYINTNNK
jgi:hypothetical protein